MLAQDAVDQQTETPLFVCTTCGGPVIVYAGQFFRTCEHANALVAATHDGLKVASRGLS